MEALDFWDTLITDGYREVAGVEPLLGRWLARWPLSNSCVVSVALVAVVC